MIIVLANATTIYVSLPTEDKIFDSILHLFSIREASINGEANSRIERLEDKLRDIEREINVENIRAYS